MLHIKPITELRNNFSEISRLVHHTHEPVFLTKNGYGDMVVMSVELYESIMQKQQADSALFNAQIQQDDNPNHYDFGAASPAVREKLKDKLIGIIEKASTLTVFPEKKYTINADIQPQLQHRKLPIDQYIPFYLIYEDTIELHKILYENPAATESCDNGL